MEQVSRMAAEVNKLIGRALLEGKSVYLAEVGSLYITASQEGVKDIDFSSAEQGSPLIEIIKERAGCTPEQAVEIFNRWKGEVHNPSNLTTTIEGVGILRNKSFITAESFAKKLNPATIKTVQNMAKEKKVAPTKAPKTTEQPTVKAESAPKPVVKPTAKPTAPQPKKSSKAIWITLVVILAAIGAYVAYDSASKAKVEKARIEAIAKEKAAEQQRIADSIALAQIEARRLAEAEAAAAAAIPPRYGVVYGVYELRSNVDVAIKKINAMYGEGSAHEHPFGALTLVTMFSSDDKAEAQAFLMEIYDQYPDSWVHDSQL